MFTFSNLSSIQNVEHGIIGKAGQLPDSCIMGEQVHKDKIVWVDDDTVQLVKGADALATKRFGITLAVQTADCVPILFVEPQVGIVGVIHAGWRGTALEITRKTFDFLRVKPFNYLVGIGPAICGNCFEVGEEVARQFDSSVVTESEQEEGKFYIDIVQANINQCLEVGISERNIETCNICTFESEEFYSSRDGDKSERNYAYIRLN